MSTHLKYLILFAIRLIIGSSFCIFLYLRTAERNVDRYSTKFHAWMYNDNTLNVEIDKNVDPAGIRIQLGNRLIFVNNRYLGLPENHHGFTTFSVYADNQLIAEAGHFKSNWWYTHDYYFRIFQTDRSVQIEFRADGPDGDNMTFVNDY